MAANNNYGCFPEDIAGEILVRCPVKSLLRFKCACKNWYALIKTPEFVQQHLNCSKNRAPQLLVYHYYCDDDNSHSITLISEENPQTFLGMRDLIGPVDGLFFMSGEINYVALCALWNPATREVRPLPLPARTTDYAPRVGFGLDPLTNDYKVVYFLNRLGEEYDAAVYSCSKDSWRIFKPKDFYKPPPFHKQVLHTYGTAYSNGVYYWLLYVFEYCSCSILLFDFGSEMFEEIEGPNGHSMRNRMLGMMLLDDSIGVLDWNHDSNFHYYDIWVMIQPGVWNILYTFQCFPQIRSCYDSSLILVTKTCRLISYNVQTNTTTRLGFQHSGLKSDAAYNRFGVYYYKDSLLTTRGWRAGPLISSHI